MNLRHIQRSFATLFISLAAAFSCSAQQTITPAPPTQPPVSEGQEQEGVRIFTEEVLLPVVALNEYGRFDPTVVPEDVLVLEDNIPQQVKSVRYVPVSVMLVIDMGSQITSLTKPTREHALKLIASLRSGDQIAIVQNSNRVELLQDWTADMEKAAHVINTQLFPGNRSRLSECLTVTVSKLRERPVGNTHLILVTDGIETRSGEAEYPRLVKRVVNTQATVHAVCYSAFSREDLGKRHFGLDFEMKRWYKEHGESLRKNDKRLTELVRETGGQISLPVSAPEIAQKWEAVARNIKAQYVITYSPKRPLTTTGVQERRNIKVHSRRIGLQLVAMRGYVASPNQ